MVRSSMNCRYDEKAYAAYKRIPLQLAERKLKCLVKIPAEGKKMVRWKWQGKKVDKVQEEFASLSFDATPN